ncbi:L-lactate dehydrogenase [Xylariaceae sp. FL0662B]|nr:L-lactate dehydrogenase [Xylariaceae sp. FL0662B]
MPRLNGAEVAKHNSRESCWLVIHSKVYDVTSFLDQHPGGTIILLKQGGADATTEFDQIHSTDVLNDLPNGSYLGDIDPETAGALNQPTSSAQPKPSSSSASSQGKIPHVSLCVTANDFEAPAKAVLPHKSWVYASSSANAGLSMKANLDDWSRISFRPRVLRGAADVDTRRSVLGHAAQWPFYVSPMGSLGVAHPEAEPAVVRGAVRKGLHAVISTASTKSAEQIMQSFADEQARFADASPSRLFFQFYCPSDHARARALLRRVKSAGYAGLFWTVDAPVLGKRLADRRLQAEETMAAGFKEEVRTSSSENAFAPRFGGRAVPGSLDPALSWDYLRWIREEWDGPIVLKGVQCVEDAKLAMEHGCDGILLSNHGGRQLHSAPSALMTLLEIRAYCPEVLEKMEVFVDGGLRDGADGLKAICLGATAVGVGRPFLYALSAYGTEGVERCADILADELVTAMKLLGITSLDQARPEMVNASRLQNEMWRAEMTPIRSRL